MSTCNSRPQLCWSCRNAVPGVGTGCEWSEKLQPVPGWDAELVHKTTFGCTWSIKVCPKYQRDGPRKECQYY